MRFLVFTFLLFFLSMPTVHGKEFGPNGCNKSMELLNVWFEHKDGERTVFKIPKAYFTVSGLDNKKGGKQSFLSLDIIKNDMSPRCNAPIHIFKDQPSYKNTVSAIIRPVTEGGFQRLLGYHLTDFFPKNAGSIENFSLFSSKKNSNFSTKELLIPNQENFEKPTFLVCRKDSKKNNGKYSECEMNISFESRLWIIVHFSASDIKLANEIQSKVLKLLSGFITP